MNISSENYYESVLLFNRYENVKVGKNTCHRFILRPFLVPCCDVRYDFRFVFTSRDRRGRDRMVVGFTVTYATSAYHHYRCEFESRSGVVYLI
jgi:hypothetical protein